MIQKPIESARIQEVIEVKMTRGAGTQTNLSRIVTQYWSKDGELLAENDPSISYTISTTEMGVQYDRP